MSTALTDLEKLSDAERQQVKAWLQFFKQSWDENLLAAFVRTLPAASNRVRVPALLELIKIDMEEQWKHGRRVTVEMYLKNSPELGNPDTVTVGLIQVEYRIREQAGLVQDLPHFARRFPRQAADLRTQPQPVDKNGSVSAQSDALEATVEPRPSTRSPAKYPSTPTSLPKDFGRYRILKRLGKGGMGSVYLAEDTQLGRRVALKVPHITPEDGPRGLQRFYREARAAATLDHPNLCRVYDVGSHENIPYLTMAYVEGKTLAQLIKGGKPMSALNAAIIVTKIAAALHEAHASGVIHRDLKPSNVMINQRGEPVVMDFGLARVSGPKSTRLTQLGALMGTPSYMPPEQINGDVDAMGPGCDIYSLGVMFYELLTGRVPFEGPVAAVLGQILTQSPEPPSVHRRDLDFRLDAVCLRAMQKEIGARYAEMGEMAAALADYLHAPTAVPKEPPLALPVKPVRVHNTQPVQSSPMIEVPIARPLQPALEVDVVLQETASRLDVVIAPATQKIIPVPDPPVSSVAATAVTKSPFSACIPSSNDRGTKQPRKANQRLNLSYRVLRGSIVGIIASCMLIGLFYLLPQRFSNELILTVTGIQELISTPRTMGEAKSDKIKAGATLETDGGNPEIFVPKTTAKKGEAKAETIVPKANLTSSDSKLDLPPAATSDDFVLKAPLKKAETILPISKKKITNSIGMSFVYVAPGKFTMGSLEYKTSHDVELTEGYYIAIHTVTQRQYEAITGKSPSWFSAQGGGKEKIAGTDTREFPVETVSWGDAKEFCRKLSQQDGKQYRLPTEAEWEYACRAGTTTRFHFGDEISTDQANYHGGKSVKFRERTTQVGSFAPNAWGLYDMHGNVWQWCEDLYDPAYYNNSPKLNPLNKTNGVYRVVRGGSWDDNATYCSSACRGSFLAPGSHRNIVGFRVVLDSPGKANTNLSRPASNPGQPPKLARDPKLIEEMKFVHVPKGTFWMGWDSDCTFRQNLSSCYQLQQA